MDSPCSRPQGWLDTYNGEATMLGICPMSEEILRAALAEAASEQFPPMFIATPRQVDASRGYTGWSQEALVGVIDDLADNLGYDGPYFVARDHGGPYQSFRDRGNPGVPLSDAMSFARELFAADQQAGFDILHVDATEDPRTDETLALGEIADRTVSLVEAIESHNDSNPTLPRYEIGTEEITGGMTDPTDFDTFLEETTATLQEDLGGVEERLLFVVVQVGTTMRVDMTNEFDPEKTRTLVKAAADHNVYLKTHFTDWLSTSELERFPELGVGASNVGPEFAAALVEGLADLTEMEQETVAGSLEKRSEFMSILKQAAVDRAPWQKYAPDGMSATQRREFISKHRTDIAYCVGRYVLNDDDVAAAREELYENVRVHTDVDPGVYVVERIREAIHRYVAAFDLVSTVGE